MSKIKDITLMNVFRKLAERQMNKQNQLHFCVLTTKWKRNCKMPFTIALKYDMHYLGTNLIKHVNKTYYSKHCKTRNLQKESKGVKLERGAMFVN
jgi:hypothetical protein